MLKGLRLNVGALIIRIRVPLKGSLTGYYKGSIVEFYNIGAFIIRIGFRGPVCYKYNRGPPKQYW